MTPLSILELVRVTEGADARAALYNARDLAAHAESMGLSPHLGGGASQHGGHRQRRDIGRDRAYRRRDMAYPRRAGGIMLPNHAPYVIAEQFGTLACLFPGRIDLGLGRAPGTDQITLRACAVRPNAPDLSRRTCWNCRPFSRRPDRASDRGGAGRGTKVPLGFRFQHLRRAGRRRARAALRFCVAFRARTCSCRRSRSIAADSSRLRSSTGPTQWSGSTSSPPTPTPKRGAWRRRSRCRSPTSFAAPGG